MQEINANARADIKSDWRSFMNRVEDGTVLTFFNLGGVLWQKDASGFFVVIDVI